MLRRLSFSAIIGSFTNWRSRYKRHQGRSCLDVQNIRQ